MNCNPADLASWRIYKPVRKSFCVGSIADYQRKAKLNLEIFSTEIKEHAVAAARGAVPGVCAGKAGPPDARRAGFLWQG